MFVNLSPSDIELLLISLDTQITELLELGKSESYINHYRSLNRRLTHEINKIERG